MELRAISRLPLVSKLQCVEFIGEHWHKMEQRKYMYMNLSGIPLLKTTKDSCFHFPIIRIYIHVKNGSSCELHR